MNFLAGSIREAVASGEFRRARALWTEYAGVLAERAGRGELEQSALEEAAGLVRWSQTTVLMARAQALAEIAQRRSVCRVLQAYSLDASEEP